MAGFRNRAGLVHGNDDRGVVTITADIGPAGLAHCNATDSSPGAMPQVNVAFYGYPLFLGATTFTTRCLPRHVFDRYF